MSDLTARMVEAQQGPARGPSLAQLIDQRADQLAGMLSNGWDLGRLRSAAAAAVGAEPLLAHCAPETVLAALLRCSQIDLEPGPLEHCFVIAGADGIARFVLGYKGVIALALRSPGIVSIDAQVIHEADEYDVTYGTAGHLFHRPTLTGDRGPAIAFYAYSRFTNGGEVYRVLTVADAEYRRSFAVEGSSFWTDHFEIMALKSALHAVRPFLPLTTELAATIALDDIEHQDPTIAEEVGSGDGDRDDGHAGDGPAPEDPPPPPEPPADPDDVPSFINPVGD